MPFWNIFILFQNSKPMIGLSPEGEANSSPWRCLNPLGQGTGPFKGVIEGMCQLSNRAVVK